MMVNQNQFKFNNKMAQTKKFQEKDMKMNVGFKYPVSINGLIDLSRNLMHEFNTYRSLEI